jgi:hypothetical protein
LVGKLGLRVLCNQPVFAFRRFLPRKRGRIGCGVEGGKLVIGFTGAR